MPRLNVTTFKLIAINQFCFPEMEYKQLNEAYLTFILLPIISLKNIILLMVQSFW